MKIAVESPESADSGADRGFFLPKHRPLTHFFRPHSPPSGPTHWLFQGSHPKSKFLAINLNNMKQTMTHCFLCILLLLFVAVSEAGARSEIDLSGSKGDWKVWQDTTAVWQSDTLYLPDQVDLSTLPINAPTVGWTTMYDDYGMACRLPASVEELFSNGQHTYRYHGVTWFYRKVMIPLEWQNKRIYFYSEKTRLRMELYINEEIAGYDCIPETPYKVDVTDTLTFGAENWIAIRLTNAGGERGWGDFPGVAWGTYEFPSGRDFSGIDTPVELIAVDPVHIDRVLVRNELPAGGRQATVITSVSNATALSQSINLKVFIESLDGAELLFQNQWSDSIPAGTTKEIEKSISVATARLWDHENPNLYRCRVEVSAGGMLDETTETFGFRIFEVKQSLTESQVNFYLNGERIRFRSAIDWGYYGMTGFYATPTMAFKSVQAARDIGHNAINFHRRIGEPRVMEYADSLGLYIYEEPGGFHLDGRDGYAIATRAPSSAAVIAAEKPADPAPMTIRSCGFEFGGQQLSVMKLTF